jgi:hypothetical protein
MTAAARKTGSKPTSKRASKRKPKARPATVISLVDARIERAMKAMTFDSMTIDKLARIVDERMTALRSRELGEPTEEQLAARDGLYDEMLKHGPAPTDAEITEAFGKWR